MPTFNTRQIVESSPAIKSTTAAYTENFILTVGGVLNICDNLTETDCEVIVQTNILRQIQLSTDILQKQTFDLINSKFLTDKPSIVLRIDAGDHSKLSDLEFLKNLPYLKSLNVFVASNRQIDKINELLILNELAIGAARVSLIGIEKQKSLQKLFVYEKPKDIEIIGQMPLLENLTFSMQTLKSLGFLIPLRTKLFSILTKDLQGSKEL